MTISAKWDEMVPTQSSFIDGARNIRIPVPEHVLAIAVAMTFYRSRWLDFILR